MTKTELSDLLHTIDREYWGKIGGMIKDVDFLKTWYEALKDYDNELIQMLYRKYDNPDFPPTAKYFSVGAENELKSLDSFYLECANEIYYFALESVSAIKKTISEFAAGMPYKERRARLENTVRLFRQEHIEEKGSFKEWIGKEAKK